MYVYVLSEMHNSVHLNPVTVSFFSGVMALFFLPQKKIIIEGPNVGLCLWHSKGTC